MTIVTKDKTDLSELDLCPTQCLAEHELFSERDRRTYIIQEQKWRAYVSQLTPDDRNGAFLLPEELPTRKFKPREIRYALSKATHRAFGNISKFRIEDYVLGRIRGEMRILLPQGREYSYYFNNECGWKATIIINTDVEEYSFLAYYRSRCMNPARYVPQFKGKLDTSRVEFTPLDSGESEQIRENLSLDYTIDNNIKRLWHEHLKL
jgi:hypothetical protein